MNAAEAQFQYPVFGFTPDREIWGFPDLDTLTSCGPRTLKEDLQSGMEIVDADGRRFVVRSIRRIGRAGPWLKWVVMGFLTGTPQSRIEHELEPLEPISLEALKQRVCASMMAFPQDYCDEDQGEILDQRLAQVRDAPTIVAVYGLIGLDSFMAY